MLQLPLDIQLDDSAKLENFYAGENCQVIERLNSLTLSGGEFYFVWGGEGVGKSHLAQAICHKVSEQGQTGVYFPLSNQGLKPEILDGLEFADLVCLDGLELVTGNADWEEALFDLFNRLKACDRNLVIFAELPLTTLGINLADLHSRLSSMEVYKLKPVQSEEQVDFVIQVGLFRGLDISIEVASFILARTNREVSKLVNIIQLLDRQSLAHQRKITIPFVKSILAL